MTDYPLMPPCEKSFTKKDQIIDLIARGETADILNDEDLGEAFKELMKYDFIDINKDRISLTALGEEARITGVQMAIHNTKLKLIVTDIPVKVGLSKHQLLIYSCLILLLITLLAVIFLF